MHVNPVALTWVSCKHLLGRKQRIRAALPVQKTELPTVALKTRENTEQHANSLPVMTE